VRRLGIGSAIALSILLTSAGGCTAASWSRVPDPDPGAQSYAAETRERTTLPAGSTITMRSGLTLTIPQGWEGVLKRGASGSAPVFGVLGRPNATESLRLRRVGGGGWPTHISVSSSRDSEASDGQLTQVDEAGAVTLFSTGGQGPNAPTLIIAQTHLPGSQYGAVLFSGDPSAARATVGEVWRLLQIEGAPLVRAVAHR